jgi:hypothetical protein
MPGILVSDASSRPACWLTTSRHLRSQHKSGRRRRRFSRATLVSLPGLNHTAGYMRSDLVLPHVTQFLATGSGIINGAAALHQDFHGFFARHERRTLIPINPQYRVFGNTGVAWGHFALMLKPKEGPARGERCGAGRRGRRGCRKRRP